MSKQIKTEPTLCTDCKWMTKATSDGKRLCERPGLGSKNVVDGGMLYPSCEDERAHRDWIESLLFGKNCGVSAKYFQPKLWP